MRVLLLLGVLVGGLSIAPAARAAATLTVCSHLCSYTTIQAAVNAAQTGDTVEVRLSGSPYTQQVTVVKQITLEGDPNAAPPVLKLAPSSSNTPTLIFKSLPAGSTLGSTLKHMNVESNGSGAVNDAVVFEQASGSIADVSATATDSAISVSASGVTVGPKVSATGAGLAALRALGSSVMITGVTAVNNGTHGAAANVGGGATIVDSKLTGGGAAAGLVLVGATAQRVVATGEAGMRGGDALVTDSLLIGTGEQAVLQLRNVTAISAGSGAFGSGIDALSGGSIVAKNVIARGGPGATDVAAAGSVQIGYSNFRTTSGAGVDTSSIGHNQLGDDPLFVNGTVGPSQDFHLQSSSPVIGAGTTDAMTGMSDLDRRPRPALGLSRPSLGAYEPTVHSLTVTVSGGGFVSGRGISCPGTCSNSYVAGTDVTLTAIAGSGSVFSGWSGACSGTGTCQVTMSSDRAVTATFTGVAPPSNTAPPAIGGTPVRGQTLVASDGTWTASPTSFTYKWQDCDTAGNQCTSITGASVNTYKLTAHDVGHTVRIVVTAMNAIASQSATSAQTATVTRAPLAARAPVLSHVRLGSPAFAAKKGTALTLTLSEVATVNVLVTQARPGREVKGRCKPGAKHGKRCTVIVQKAKLAFRGMSGPDRFKLLIRRLAPGRYTVTITARAGGKNSKPIKLNFTDEKPRKK